MRRGLPLSVLVLVLALACGPARAVQPDEMLSDPAMEHKAREISAELRCLVCQNQSIDDSDAPLARDLRLIVRERLKAGDDRAAVIDFVVARYGEFILLRPRLTAKTVLLWLAPLLLLIGGGFLAYRLFRRPRAEVMAAPAPLSDAEREKLRGILGKG
ncbi:MULTISPECIES: cytochrome c-type biogenesis protein [Rhodomicrobium]|uniref:cytochrome c-type biogenesis protein n=1 Tax=Rhodomicrobium TaxID=1068 RepID=UPI000B4BE5C9|nr:MULTISPECIES: cytochrome c-type biogenesis protein [Rhodomicrobium]